MSFTEACKHKEKVQAFARTSFSQWLNLFLTSCSPAEPVSASVQQGKSVKHFLYFQPVQILGGLQLEQSLEATESFLRDEVNFDLNELINAEKLHKLVAMEKGINAIYTNDETKRKFQVLAREVFRKYRALQPDRVLNQYAPRKNAIDVLYTAITDNVESADVVDIMRKIQNIVDESVVNLAEDPGPNENRIIDISGLDFNLLQQQFAKIENKNTAVQSLKDKVEKQLKRMLERNPMTIDFYRRYQEIIEEYNKGKDEVVIKETFTKLIELIKSYSEEIAETKREGLTDEQKAIFDILRYGKSLSEQEKSDIKRIAIELLQELKKDKLTVEQWTDKQLTAAVYNYVYSTLFEILPYPTYQTDDIDLKTILVYEHLRNQYYGGGNSIYGQY
jgi:type I restriction enzyme R subunit